MNRIHRIIEIVKKFQKDIRSKFLSNFWNIQHGNKILSYDYEMVTKFNVSPIKTAVNIFLFILFLIVPGVSIISYLCIGYDSGAQVYFGILSNSKYIYCIRNSSGLFNLTTAILEIIIIQLIVVKFIICSFNKDLASKLLLRLQCAWSRSESCKVHSS